MSVLVTAYLCRNLLDKHTYEGKMHSGRPDYKEKKYELIKAQARVMSRKIPLKNVPIALIHQGEKPIVGRAISAALVNDDKEWKVKFRIDTSQLKGMITKQFIESGLLTDVSLNHMPAFDANGEPDDEPIEISVCAKGAREGSTIEECVKAAKGFEELIKKATATFHETYPQESIQSNPIPGDSMIVIEPIQAACKEHGKENCQHDQCDGYSALNHSGDTAMVDSLVNQGIESGKKHPTIPETDVPDSKELCYHKNPINNCHLNDCEGNHKKNQKSNSNNYKPNNNVKANTSEAGNNNKAPIINSDIKMPPPPQETTDPTQNDGSVAAANYTGLRVDDQEPKYDNRSGSLPDPSKLRNAGILPQLPGSNNNSNGNRRPDVDMETEVERRVQQRLNQQQKPASSPPASTNGNSQAQRQPPPPQQQQQQQQQQQPPTGGNQQQQDAPPPASKSIFSSGDEYTDLLYKSITGKIFNGAERQRMKELAENDRKEKLALAQKLAEVEKQLAGAKSEINEGSETFSTLLSHVTGVDKNTFKKDNLTELSRNAETVLASHLFGGGQNSNSNYEMEDEAGFNDFANNMGVSNNGSSGSYNTSQYSTATDSSNNQESIAAAAGNGNRGATGLPRRQDNHNRFRTNNNNNRTNNNSNNAPSSSSAPSTTQSAARIQAYRVEKGEWYNQAGGWIHQEPNPLNPKFGPAHWAYHSVDNYRPDPTLGKQAELGVIPESVNAGQRDMNKGRRYF